MNVLTVDIFVIGCALLFLIFWLIGIVITCVFVIILRETHGALDFIIITLLIFFLWPLVLSSCIVVLLRDVSRVLQDIEERLLYIQIHILSSMTKKVL